MCAHRLAAEMVGFVIMLAIEKPRISAARSRHSSDVNLSPIYTEYIVGVGHRVPRASNPQSRADSFIDKRKATLSCWSGLAVSVSSDALLTYNLRESTTPWEGRMSQLCVVLYPVPSTP